MDFIKEITSAESVPTGEAKDFLREHQPSMGEN